MVATGKYAGLEPIGCIGVSNTASINVYQIDTYGDKALVGVNAMPPRWLKLYSTKAGETYFKFRNTRYKMSEVMRLR